MRSFPTCAYVPLSQIQGYGQKGAHPVADPVVRADVDERTHPALEQRGDVELRREHLVVRCRERRADVVAAAAEVRGQGRVHADPLAHVGPVEVRADRPVRG